ncbi:arylesterase [Thalassovita mangrovi]|nr:arylesterase [Thalassovita mangrovi]
MLISAGPAMAAPATLIAFGDSLTQGYGLIEQEGFVPQLRAWLAGQGADVRVINAGVSGDTTAGGLARLDWSLTWDVQGMILALGGNDALRGTDPGVTRANVRAMLQVAQDKGVEVLLVGLRAPGNFGPEYQAEFNAIWPELSEEFGTLYAESFFEGLGETDPAELGDLFQPDGIHPNGEGVRLIVEGLGPKVLELIERLD